MKRFQFRLDRLLWLREKAEQQEAAALGTAMSDERRERDRLARADAMETKAAEQAAATSSSGTVIAGARAHLDLAREAAARMAEGASEDVAAATARTEAARELFGEKRKDRRAVERLKEQRQTAWHEEFGREDRKTMDDVAQRLRTTEGNR